MRTAAASPSSVCPSGKTVTMESIATSAARTKVPYSRTARTPGPREVQNNSRPGLAILSDPRSDEAHEHEQQTEADDPRDGAFGDRTDVADGRSAAVVRLPQRYDVGDDRVDLVVVEGVLAEHRHLARPGEHRL